VSSRAERFTVPCTFHGEGPFWDSVNNRLLLVDMLAGTVVAVAEDGDTRRHKLATVAAAIRARRSGGYVLATENQFMLLGPDLTEQTALPLSSPTRLSA
jgi:sugar lactone lactonase YvrE